jgi:integrase
MAEAARRANSMKGSLYRHGKYWCVRYRGVNEKGEPANLFHKLALLSEYPRKSELKDLFEDFMQSVNDAPRSRLSHAISVADLVEQHYLTYVKLHKSASTSHGYEGLWNRYGKESALAPLKVIQVRTVDIRQLLLSVQSERQLAKRTFQHLKSFLSAIFTYGLNEGLIKTNPVHGTMLPEDAMAPRETYAYNLAEIHQMLNILIGAPKAFVAIAALAGLRLGEIQGLRWEDTSKDEIQVNRSVWRGIADEPKTTASKAAVPIIPTLHTILEEYRAECRGAQAGPLFDRELEKLAQRTVKPIVEGAGLIWHGAHALRRGIATNLYSLGASDKIVQRILRHSKATVTKEHYIKAVPDDVKNAMLQFEAKISSGTQTVHNLKRSSVGSA